MIDPSSPTPTGGITAPFVSIQSTAVQTSYQSGAFVTLAAIARDAQGSDLASQVMWSSSLMGHLGSGGQLSVVLTTGTHMISASVTDARGMMRTARATVVVGN